MELKDILSQQAAWLDMLRKDVPLTTAMSGGAALTSIDMQAKAIEARIADLTRQKADVTRQFDAAIARQNDTLTALKAGTPANLTANVLQPPKKK